MVASRERMALPPGPRSAAWTVWNFVRRPCELLEECAASYGDAFTLRVPTFPPLVVFADPAHVKEIFADDGQKMHAGALNRMLFPFLGAHSLFTMDGVKHRRDRRLLLPPFHGDRMHAYGGAMLEATDACIDRLPEGETISLLPALRSLTLDVTLRAVFGIEDDRRLRELNELFMAWLDLWGSWIDYARMQIESRRLGPLFSLGRFHRRMAEIDRVVLGEISRRRRDGVEGRSDILSLLVAARDDGEGMSDQEIRDELVTLLVAGHETTATTLAWAFRWILDTPSVERKIIDELRHAYDNAPLEKRGEVPFLGLPFLDAALAESMRLQPAGPLVGRVLAKPTIVGRWSLPANVVVACSVLLTQRSPAIYAEPRRYLPERFLGKKFGPFDFYPFGGGIRRCIGMAFASYEMKIVLARFLERTTLRLEHRGPIRGKIHGPMFVPAHGLRVRVVRRGRPLSSETRS